VDAILSFSNRWDVQGSYPQIHEVASQGIPLFVLNAETGEPGVYNLSAETEVLTVSLTWMFKEMGDVGEFVYFNFGGNNFHQNIIDTVLKDYPGIKATAIPAQYGDQSLTGDSISQLIKDHPEVDAIWANEGQMDIFWGMNDHLGDSQLPLTTCVPRRDMLEAWKERVDNGAPFRCIAFIQPGGVAYEGVYAAYYLLSGMQINPDALVGDWGNTLRYPIPVITNDTLDDWIAQLDTFREGMYQTLELPPMSAEEIRQAWFND
jgi:ABC-type sugar transport system substrate-binding protein